MRFLQPVIWSKGVFLSPQHLQTQDRYFEDSLHFQVESLFSWPWGFDRLLIDQAALPQGMFALVQCSGLFPDGLAFDMPATDALPPARPLHECLPEGASHVDFFLAVPQQRDRGLNVGVHASRGSTRYVADLRMMADETNGVSEKPVHVARKNIRILAGHESREGSACLPLARVERTSAGLHRLAPAWVPPLLKVDASPCLSGILRGIVELLASRGAQLSGGRRQKNQTLADFGSTDVANFWLLYTINTCLPELRHFLDTRSPHPEVLYAAFIDLAGALTTFSETIQPRDLPSYEHENLGGCFQRLDRQLRELLQTTVATNVVSLPLRLARETIHTASIDQDRYLDATRLYLAVAAEMPEADLIACVPRLCKMCSGPDVEHLVRQALPGLALRHTPAPPREIPVKLRHQYFSVERSGPAWDSIVRSRSVAVHAPGEIVHPEMELVIVLPEGRTA